MKKKKTKLEILLSILLAALAMLYIIPFLTVVLGFFESQAEAAEFDLSFPSKWLFSNYAYVMESGKILSGYINSVIITIPATFVSLVLGALAGTVTSRRNDKICGGLYYYFISGLMLTLQIASTFFPLEAFHIYGALFSVICIFISLRILFTVMTLSSFMKRVPKEIDETAMIDGYNFGKIVFYVLLPVLKPIAVTNITMTVIDAWNNFMIPLLHLSSAKKTMVATAVYSLPGRYNRDWQYVFGVFSLAMLPTLVLFVILQRHIVAGMTPGTVKGRWVNRMKVRFAVIGYGWRAGFFYRLVRTLSNQSKIMAGVLRTRERTAQAVEEYSMFATDNLEGALETKPDFVVLCVPRGIVKDHPTRLMKARCPALCETPLTKNVREMEELWEVKAAYNGKVQAVEQYFLQSYYAGLLQIIDQGYLGEVSGVMLSAPHGYHTVSILRKFLGVGFENCWVQGQRFTADVTAANPRSGFEYDGRVIQADRDWISMAFEQGKTAFLDFSGEQYFSPIRTRRLNIQGVRGETNDMTVRCLNRENVTVIQEIQRNDIGVYNNMEWLHKGTVFLGREIYTSPYYPARLNNDEIAVASCLTNMKEFVETGKEFYSPKGALQDTYLSFTTEEAIEKKQMAEISRQIWADQGGAAGLF